VRIGRSGWSAARGKDKFDRGYAGGMVRVLSDEDVAGGAFEQCGQDPGGGVGTIVAEDVLIGYGAGDLHAGDAGDCVEDLVEAGVVGNDGEATVLVRDGGGVIRG
jgi:hypothetical protein